MSNCGADPGAQKHDEGHRRQMRRAMYLSADGRWQFSLRAAIGFVFGVCVLLGTFLIGTAAFLLLGMPAAILGFQIITGASIWGKALELRQKRTALGLVFLGVILEMIAVIAWGWPYGLNSIFAVAGVLVWTFLLATRLSGRKAVCCAMIPMVVACDWIWPFLPTSGKLIYDLRTGRRGIRHIGDVVFARKGVYTDLVESYLGPLTPEWCPHTTVGFFASTGGFHHYLEYTPFTGSLNLSVYLQQIPSYATRKTVLRCLSARDNTMRQHQSLVLIALRAFGYPEGYTAESWWRENVHRFKITSYDQRAPRYFLVAGNEIEAHAVLRENAGDQSRELGDVFRILQSVRDLKGRTDIWEVPSEDQGHPTPLFKWQADV